MWIVVLVFQRTVLVILVAVKEKVDQVCVLCRVFGRGRGGEEEIARFVRCMGTWELGSSLSTVAVVSAAHRDPIRAVRWVNAVVEELPASDARVQRNFAVVLRALASRIDVAVVDLARRLVTDPFARETLSMPGGAFAEEENMEEHRPEKLQRMDEEYAESDQRKHSNDTLSSTMVTVVETDEKCEGSQENFEQEKKQEEGMRDTLIEGGRLEALVGLEGEIAEELDSWAARGDAGRRIEPPKRATNTMKASTMPVAWASRLSSSQVMWSDDAVAVLIENLLTTGNISAVVSNLDVLFCSLRQKLDYVLEF